MANIAIKNINLLNGLQFLALEEGPRAPLHEEGVQKNYGNKYAGRVAVDALLARDPIDGVTTPLRHGISHETTLRFLEERAPALFAIWKELAEDFARYPDLPRSSFLERGEVRAKLAEIEAMIQRAYAGMTTADVAHFENEEALTSYLEKIAARGAHLMVRSSSSEDSKELANAGGNTSISYVVPRLDPLFAASAEVVSSYFSLSSLKNQIEAGSNPFERIPLLSLLLDELIGEPLNGAEDPVEIPISLVLFTQEPNDSEEGFPLMKISAVFGHGEGVVNHENVGSDTVHLVRKGEEYFSCYQNRLKTKRLMPCDHEGATKLTLVENSPLLHKRRVLDDALLARLALLGERIESAFGCPMDLEIVIQRGVIYIVQARPIVRPQAKPTYLSEHAPLEMLAHAKPLVSGRGSVEVISDREAILYCNSLKEAEERFRRGVHKLVIVTKDEPDNSHPVINFSGLGIICLYTQQREAIDLLLQKCHAQLPLVVCPQSGRLALMVSPGEYILPGYSSHPAAIGHSLAEGELRLPALGQVAAPSPLQEALRSLREATTTEVALRALGEIQETPSFVQLRERRVVYPADLPASLIMQRMDERLATLFHKIRESFAHPTPRLEGLFYIKSLSTILAGQPKEALYAYSLLQVDRMGKRVDHALDYQRKIDRPSQWVDYLHFGEYALSLQGKALWEQFLLDLERAPASPAFKELIERLTQHHALPTWINRFVLPLFVQKRNARATREALLKMQSGEDETLYTLLNRQQEQVELLKKNLHHFADPKTFVDATHSLQEMMRTLASKEFFAPFHQASEMGKIAGVELLNEFVEVADLAIKTMKASAAFTEEEKLRHLHALLTANFSLLESWLMELPDRAAIPFIAGWDLARYLGMMRAQLNRIDLSDRRNLFPSRGFSVQAAMLGSLANHDRHLPSRLDDLFTLIHQNLIFTLTRFNHAFFSQVILHSLFLSPLLQEGIDRLGSMEIPDLRPPLLSGVKISEEGISCQYNIALRNHSASFELEQASEGGPLLMHGKLFGRARRRWPALSGYLNVLSQVGVLPLKEPPEESRQQLLFTWVLDSPEKIRSAQEEFRDFLTYSMGGRNRVQRIEEGMVERANRRGVTAQMGTLYFTSFLETGRVSPLSERFAKNRRDNPIPSMQEKALVETIQSNYGYHQEAKIVELELKFLTYLFNILPNPHSAHHEEVSAYNRALLQACHLATDRLLYRAPYRIFQEIANKQILWDFLITLSRRGEYGNEAFDFLENFCSSQEAQTIGIFNTYQRSFQLLMRNLKETGLPLLALLKFAEQINAKAPRNVYNGIILTLLQETIVQDLSQHRSIEENFLTIRRAITSRHEAIRQAFSGRFLTSCINQGLCLEAFFDLSEMLEQKPIYAEYKEIAFNVKAAIFEKALQEIQAGNRIDRVLDLALKMWFTNQERYLGRISLLFTAFIDKEFPPQEAIDSGSILLTTLSDSEDPYVLDLVAHMFNQSIPKNLYVEEALAYARKNFASYKAEKHLNYFSARNRLFEQLIQKGYLQELG